VVAPLLTRGFAFIIGDKISRPGPARLISFQGKIMAIEKTIDRGFWSACSVIIAGLLLANNVKLDTLQEGNQFLPKVFPVEVVDLMVDDPPDGDGFNYFPWGGYLLFRLWPEKLVFIDGQTDFYGEELTRQYERVITLSHGWEEVLHEYDVDWVIMPVDSKLVTRLRSTDGWEILYQDDVAAVILLNDRISDPTGTE
jgi:hypothetical protein